MYYCLSCWANAINGIKKIIGYHYNRLVQHSLTEHNSRFYKHNVFIHHGIQISQIQLSLLKIALEVFVVIKKIEVFLDYVTQYITVRRQLNGTLLCHDF